MNTSTPQNAAPAHAGAADSAFRPPRPLPEGAPTPLCAENRPRARGKFLFVGDQKLYVRGVTYGAFRPGPDGDEFHDLDVIDRDFAQMAANGVNTVRIPHTTPPRALLDAAARHGLWVMVGLSAEQLLGYVIDKRRDVDPERVVRERVRDVAGHPALLCYALGNEIPARVARWYGSRRVERYLEGLCRAVRDEDPEGLVTYVNYPSTEYLDLSSLDLLCYNVYLESQPRLEAYLARLHNIAGDRPLILSEIGLDGLRHGALGQARSLEWQIRTAFSGGCAGVFVFAWTDEWYRGGADVDDWEFGLTHRDRRPKPALTAVRTAFGQVPFPDASWPPVSVVVCTYNGSRAIRDTLEGLARLDYRDVECIVVDDGSVDSTADIVAEYPWVRLIQTDNRGLSHARNTGLAAATGEIVAYLDDDAYPDPHWLQYLASTFEATDHAAVGGPNLPPDGDGWIADCIANAPGGPVHVLLSDRVAEHIPGCNMAFRKPCLEAIGGFDPQFRVAGDDVDVCWRLQERGWTLGFHPAAVVWHHRRDSVLTYWRQQRGYGRAEGLLKRKWPKKYSGSGQLSWAGRIYSRSLTRPLTLGRDRIYHGTWGAAPFQRLYQPALGTFYSLPLMPEWYLAIPVLAALSALAVLWRPLVLVLPVLACMTVTPLLQAWLTTRGASFNCLSARSGSRWGRLGLRIVTTVLHVMHPVARLWGRLQVDWWDATSGVRPTLPLPGAVARWVERGQAPEHWVREMVRAMQRAGAPVRTGGDWDAWDLEVEGGGLGAARAVAAVEDHGAGNQLFRARWWPTVSMGAWMLTAALVVLSLVAGLDGAPEVAAILGGAAACVALRTGRQCGLAVAAIQGAVGDRK